MNHDSLRGLNAFSRRFLKALLREYPDWEQYAKVGGIYPGRDPIEDGTLLMCIPRPVGPLEEHMQISTSVWESGPEVTLQFGGSHEHIDGWAFRDLAKENVEGAIVARVLSDVGSLVSERWAVYCTVKDGRVTGGGSEDSGEYPEWFRYCVGSAYRVRSWKGTYDAEGIITNAMIGTKGDNVDDQ